jgi:hypothetical protein
MSFTRTRETIFDQSIATQERIDIILRSLHDICMQPLSVHFIELYTRNITRLRKEAQTKFTPVETDKSNEFIDIINKLKNKWGSQLYTKSSNQFNAINEFNKVLSVYEDWLYLTLDRHGMLMRDRADEREAIKVV